MPLVARHPGPGRDVGDGILVRDEVAAGEAPSPAEGSNPKPTPAALKTLLQAARAHPERFDRALTSGRARAAVQAFVEMYSRPSLTWDDLPFLRERTRLPIVLKGIVHPDDAPAALAVFADLVTNPGSTARAV